MTANRSWMIVTMIVIVATVSGCSSELPEMEMIDNNQALQYVTVCQYGLAMAKVDKMMQSMDEETRAEAALVKAVVYLDQNDVKEAEALYPTIIAGNKKYKTIDDARKAVEGLVKNVRAVRKQNRGSEYCN